jgi:hypothetical protein
MNENQLMQVKKQELTPAVWGMLQSIAAEVSIAKTERAKVAKHLVFCLENGLPLSLAVNGGLYTVNNRVEVEGTVIRAQIRKHPDYDYRIVRLDDTGAEIEILLHGEVLGSAGFTEEDAKRAELLSGTNYQKYPADMYFNRATSRAYKRFCPDIFMQSIYVRGEVFGTDFDDAIEGEIVEPVSMQELISVYGHTAVMEAMQENGSQSPATLQGLLENNGGKQ